MKLTRHRRDFLADPVAGSDEQRVDEVTRVERWQGGATVEKSFPGGAEIFVLKGSFEEGGEHLDEGSWLRLPPGSSMHGASEGGCLLFVKDGAVAGLDGDDS